METKEFNTEIYDGLHYVLVDEKGDAIHAIIEENNFPYMTNKMEQGKVYDISLLHTRNHQKSNYKVIDHEAQVFFNQMTKFTAVQDTFPLIPLHSFRLLEFDQLGAELKKQKEGPLNQQIVLSDVYGCVKSIVPEHRIPVKNNEKLESICEITMENLRREDLNITLWGDTAREFNVEAVRSLTVPVLAVFTSLRVTLFKERITPSSTNHTCFIIDPEVAQRDLYRNEFSRPGDKVKIIANSFKQLTQAELKDQQRKTVADLNALDPDLYAKETVYSIASICRFPTHSGWWYKGCPSCHKQLKQKEDSNELTCTKHAIQTALPCYRVYMTIKDKDNYATVIVMGKEGEQLFGSTCEDLLNKRTYPTEHTLPKEIKQTIGQTYQFHIKVNPNSELVVKNIVPDPEASLPLTEKEPTSDTPDQLLSEIKRGIHASKRALFTSEPHKTSKRQSERGTTTSSSGKGKLPQKDKYV
ncbi:putative nucleic acid-binding protein [Rosa chinensis]|uniref:Putative nucleic acid-binding protein n=1 Tax=Rosa chinensis TaxID=74649 RepID=A0A2P6SLI2_ROSCH|nr:putative nucleic acid-binding protein [Rosa chinensis]